MQTTEIQKLILYMDKEQHRQFKVLCSQQNLFMTHVACDLIQRWMDGEMQQEALLNQIAEAEV